MLHDVIVLLGIVMLFGGFIVMLAEHTINDQAENAVLVTAGFLSAVTGVLILEATPAW